MNGAQRSAPMQDTDGHIIMGMTLRDWFAGQALAGLMANQATFKNERASGEVLSSRLAGAAYSISDAMLASRK